MILQKKQFGFSLLEKRPLAEISAVMYRLRHDRTGLELVWLKRQEENKTFGIAFETLPWDDTGVFHILEHSVLCGSKRYPVKEPFVDLMKSSMNTFLNAMTFSDKTFFPISSKNRQDFFNLMRVYLDAVFSPNIYEKPEIFQQEGWHYEFGPDGEPSYQGVVFNEMKGAFADEQQLLETAMNQALFPQTSYRYVSGGDPEKIPDLTYEAFIQSHRTFYSPSNAYVFLDGDVDIQTVLQILDEEYLRNLEPGRRFEPPAYQAPVDGGNRQITFEIGAEEDIARRAGIAWGRVIGSYEDREKLVAMQILADVLCGDNQSPLNKAILSAGLAESVSMEIQSGILQPWALLQLHNLDVSRLEEAKKFLFAELERLAAEGLNHERLRSSMVNLEFQLRERDYGTMPQGLVFGIQALESWLYGGDPAANLTIGTLFEKLQKDLDKGYFENLIRQILLENNHRCEISLIPSKNAGTLRREREKARLKQESAFWDDEKRKELKKQEATLLRVQREEDTPENRRLLPHLKLSDISDMPERIPAMETETAGIRLLRHPIDCNGITYFTLYFDSADCTAEELSCLSFLCHLIGQIDTKDHTAEEIASMTGLVCGSLQLRVVSFNQVSDCQGRATKLCLMCSTLTQNVGAAVELVTELLTQTKFESEDAVCNILRQIKMQMFQQIVMSGSEVAVGRINAQTSAAGAAEEYANGFAFYQWLCKEMLAEEWQRLLGQCKELASRIFKKDRLTLSMTGIGDGVAERVAKLFAQKLPDGENSICTAEMLPWGVRREAILIPGDISFAVAGGNLSCCGREYSGSMRVAARIISLAYLWNVIRVQGGAYGTGLRVRPFGLMTCYSYRDPSAATSLDSYQKAGAFLRGFSMDAENLTDFIVGTVAETSPLLSPRMKGAATDADYWCGISYEMRCKERNDILKTTPTALKKLADDMEKVIQCGGFCIIGAKNQVETCGPLDLLENV